MRRLIEDLLPPGEEILDIGCGTGANIAYLAETYRCVGVDVSSIAIQKAKQRFPSVTFINAHIENLKEQLNTTPKLITMMDVLEHVEDDFALLSQGLSLLPTGGYALLTVPAEPALWSVHDEQFEHYRRYTFERFERIWRDMPVTPLLVSYYNSLLYPAVKTVRTLGKWTRGRDSSQSDFDQPSAVVNSTLKRLFASEARVLIRALRKQSKTPFVRGVSLIAILRLDAPIETIYTKPDGLPPDHPVNAQ